MTSFALAIEPAPAPRATAIATLAHLAAAASPWIARVPVPAAAALSLCAIVGLVLTVARLPGRHATLTSLAVDERGCRIRRAGADDWLAAELTGASRAYAGLVVVAVRSGGRRYGWLLPRGTVSPDSFRRLKARVRLAC